MAMGVAGSIVLVKELPLKKGDPKKGESNKCVSVY
jgi:hypothetical protein